MVTSPLPSGRFAYGTLGAVAVEVSHHPDFGSGLVPVSPSVWASGNGFSVHLDPDELRKSAEALRVDMVRYAHWLIAFEAARIIVGYADDRFNSVLSVAHPTGTDWMDRREAMELHRRRCHMAILLAIVLAKGLLPYHPGLVRNSAEEEVIRRHFLFKMGVTVEPAPFSKSARILGEEGQEIQELLSTRILPYMRDYLR